MNELEEHLEKVTEHWLKLKEAGLGVRIKTDDFGLKSLDAIIRLAVGRRKLIKPLFWSLRGYRVCPYWTVPLILIINDIPEEDLDQDNLMAYLSGLPCFEDTLGNAGYGISLVNRSDVLGKSESEILEVIAEVGDVKCGVILCSTTDKHEDECFLNVRHALENAKVTFYSGPARV